MCRLLGYFNCIYWDFFFSFQAYEAAFIHRIKQKHIRAKNYFAQIPAMASFLHKSDSQANANEFLIATPIPAGTKP